jgi:hypothetical protein
MFMVYIFFCSYTVRTGNRNAAAANGSFFKTQLCAAFAVYTISRNLPDGWITALRALPLALLINGGIALGILYFTYGS